MDKIYYLLLLILFLNGQFCSSLFDQSQKNLERAKEILEKYPLIDGHNDWSYMIRENFKNRIGDIDMNDFKQYEQILSATDNITHTDIKRIKEGKLGGAFWAIYASCNSLAKDAVRIHLEQIDLIYRIIQKYPNEFQFVKESGDIMKAFKAGKIVSLLGLESGHAIDSSLAILRIFYDLGVRYMTLTHNCDLPWVTNNRVDRLANASAYGGLTQFGRKVIREMNRLGMMVDLSHVSYQTMLDALDESKAPVIFSHSSVYKLCNHTRNVRDDVLLKLKQNRGVIMINFYNFFVKNQGQNVNINDVVAHFNYVKNLIGVDYIGIGADYDGVDETPQGLEDVSKYPNLFAALLEQNWTEEELGKIAGNNIIRVLEEVEKYAKSVEKIEPIDDIIEQSDLGTQFKKCRTSF